MLSLALDHTSAFSHQNQTKCVFANMSGYGVGISTCLFKTNGPFAAACYLLMLWSLQHQLSLAMRQSHRVHDHHHLMDQLACSVQQWFLLLDVGRTSSSLNAPSSCMELAILAELPNEEDELLPDAVQHEGQLGRAMGDALDINGHDFPAIAQMARRPQHQFENRSWQHALHASVKRSQQLAAARSQVLLEERKCLKTELACVKAMSTSCTELDGSLSHLPPTSRCVLDMKHAFATSVRSNKALQLRQIRAVRRVVPVLKAVQAARLCTLMSPFSMRPGHGRIIKLFHYMMDSTKQRLKVCLLDKVPGEMEGRAYLNQTVMVQSGCFYIEHGDNASSTSMDPVIMNSLLVDVSNGDSCVECILRSLPFNVQATSQMYGLCSGCDYFIFVVTVDRDSCNGLAMAWLLNTLSTSSPVTTIPHVELCSAHGVHLAKDRSPVCKSIAVAAASLAKQYRHTRFFRHCTPRLEELPGKPRLCAPPTPT